jgi:protein-S-isoprenylcysteine O-methyltransferase Ste14
LEVGSWEFKTDGPYGWVRHPIYLGWFLIVFAVPAMTMTRVVFAVISGIYILIAIPLEERSLRRASRGSYDAYADLVRWKLVPWVY